MEATERQIMEINKRMNKMDEDLNAIKKTGEENNKGIEKITELLSGAQLNPHDKGLLGEVIELEKKMAEQEKRIQKVEMENEKARGTSKWTTWALISILSVLITLFISQIFK